MASIHIQSLSYQFYSDLLMSYFIILLLLPISKSILFPAFLTHWIFFHYFLIICWLGHHELFLGFCVRYGKRRCKYTDNRFENSQFSKVYQFKTTPLFVSSPRYDQALHQYWVQSTTMFYKCCKFCFSIQLKNNMFYYIPVWTFPIQSLKPQGFFPQLSTHTQLPNSLEDELEPSKFAGSFQFPTNLWTCYLKIFEEELRILLEKQQKKVWTEVEDKILESIDQNQVDWSTISKRIQGTNSEMCRRRHNRIKHMKAKWPQQVDSMINKLYQHKKTKWSSIANEINEKLGDRYRYTGKMIKQRYEFYLRRGIDNSQWTVEEDIRLLEEIRKKGRYWKRMLSEFVGRTQLQLKNRYNGTLKLVERRVLNRLQQQIQTNN